MTAWRVQAPAVDSTHHEPTKADVRLGAAIIAVVLALVVGFFWFIFTLDPVDPCEKAWKNRTTAMTMSKDVFMDSCREVGNLRQQ